MGCWFYGNILTLILVTQFSSTTYGSIRCKNENGDPIDWSIVYKLPKESKNYQSDGLESVFMTSKGEKFWVPAKSPITSVGNLIGSTLLPLYEDNGRSLNYILYSDQPHKGESVGEGGHSKGVLAFDSSTGFWLIHSVPSFPPDPKASKRYDYPSTGIINGQTFLCFSFKTEKMLPIIVQQLLYIRPNIFSYSLTQTISKQIPVLADLINKRWIQQSYNHQILKTLEGQALTSFGKSPKANLDIYSNIAAKSLKINLLAETWRKGAGGPLPSECNQTYQVVNIDQVSINYKGKSFVWSYREDHSKWAVSSESNNPVVCIGDVNRMASQAKRGGGLVCMKNKLVWNALHSSIYQFAPCPKVRPKRESTLFDRAINFFTNIFTSKFSLPAKTLTRDRTKKELR